MRSLLIVLLVLAGGLAFWWSNFRPRDRNVVSPAAWQRTPLEQIRSGATVTLEGRLSGRFTGQAEAPLDQFPSPVDGRATLGYVLQVDRDPRQAVGTLARLPPVLGLATPEGSLELDMSELTLERDFWTRKVAVTPRLLQAVLSLPDPPKLSYGEQRELTGYELCLLPDQPVVVRGGVVEWRPPRVRVKGRLYCTSLEVLNEQR